MVCYQTQVFVITIVTGECTVLLLQKYGFNIFASSFGFRSSSWKLYIHLRCNNTQRRTTTQFSLWSPSSRVSLLCWYYKNTVLKFVWYHSVFIQLIIKFVSIYPASTHIRKHHHHVTSLISYHLSTVKLRNFIRGQPIFMWI